MSPYRVRAFGNNLPRVVMTDLEDSSSNPLILRHIQQQRQAPILPARPVLVYQDFNELLIKVASFVVGSPPLRGHRTPQTDGGWW